MSTVVSENSETKTLQLLLPGPGSQPSSQPLSPPLSRAATAAAGPVSPSHALGPGVGGRESGVGPETRKEEEHDYEQGIAKEQATVKVSPSHALLDARSHALSSSAPPGPTKYNIGSVGTVEELSPEEYMALLTNEQIIQDEFKNSIDVGLALAEIRDRRLYRNDYTGFPEYYRTKWHFDGQKVYFLTRTAEIYSAVVKGGTLPKPECAYELRPLLPLAVDKARLAWERAAELAAGRKISQRLVRSVVLELKLNPALSEERVKVRQERTERRQQLTQTMAELLEAIVGLKPHQELVNKASLLDQHIRYFFPKKQKAKSGK